MIPTSTYFNKLVNSLRAMTLHSQSAWTEIEIEEKHTRDVLARVSKMIDTARGEYRQAIKVSTGKLLVNITRHWTPERVLSVNPDFPALCKELEDERIWKRLKRKERKFIADAVEIGKGAK